MSSKKIPVTRSAKPKPAKRAPKAPAPMPEVKDGAAFQAGWSQLEALRTITEMTGGLHHAQQQHLKLWPRIAVFTSVRSTATWDPGEVGKAKDQPAPALEAPSRVQSVDEVRCHHEVWDETKQKMVRMYRAVCTKCRPDLAWPGRLGGAKGKTLTFDIDVAPRKKEPEGLDRRLHMLAVSVQHMLGADVKVVVNVGGKQTFVEERKK